MRYLSKCIYCLLPIAVVALFVFQYMLSNDLAAGTAQIHEIDDAINKEEARHARLQRESASLRSLSIIEEKAVAMGFVNARTIVTVLREKDVALR